VGDFKLEVNWEYRFKLFWLLEGALFVDAGNVWKVNRTEKIPGSLISTDFYKDIAIDCGPGLRLDLNFFLIRADWGIRMRDPAKMPGERFVLFNNGKWMRNTVLNIAIGYPF
jgi:outer membrane protein assembly factor BamA